MHFSNFHFKSRINIIFFLLWRWGNRGSNKLYSTPNHTISKRQTQSVSVDHLISEPDFLHHSLQALALGCIWNNRMAWWHTGCWALTQSFWFSRSDQGRENLYFKAPKWHQSCWSGNSTLKTTVLKGLYTRLFVIMSLNSHTTCEKEFYDNPHFIEDEEAFCLRLSS